jgi:hypothetical protein
MLIDINNADVVSDELTSLRDVTKAVGYRIMDGQFKTPNKFSYLEQTNSSNIQDLISIHKAI